jgi:replicative DNA helicase
MIYVFDTSSIRSLQHFYPSVFRTIWAGLDVLVQQQQLISTREVWNELETQNISKDVLDWASQNRQIFTTPTAQELQFVAQIFQNAHF